jgi:hypothetical protein
MSDKKKTTMLDLAGSPSFNYEAAADALNTSNASPSSKNNTLRNINLSLEALGFTPGPTGFAADIANTALYAIQGKFGDAALSALAVTPIVGSIAAKKIKLERAIQAGEETVTFYRGVRVGDEPIMSPSNLKYIDKVGATDNIFAPGSFKGPGFDTMGHLADEAYENAFRKTKNIRFSDKALDGRTGQSQLDTYVTTSPQQAIYYAMDQPIDIADALKADTPLQILKIEIPVKELKRLESIPADAGSFLTGSAFKSNDYFLKKIHNLGTGRTTPRSLFGETKGGVIQGFAEVKPQIGFRNTTPGNDVSIFSLGIDPGYVTVLKGDNYDDLIKKFPEMKGHVLENLSIRNSLTKRKMSTNYNDYNYYEFTD